MLGQILRPPSATVAQHVIADCHLPSNFLAKRRLRFERKGRLPVVCMSGGGNGPLISRFLAEAGIGGPRMESSVNGSTARDLDAGDESLQQLSSTGTAPLPPGTSFSELSFTDHHLLVLGFIACVMTGALSCVLLAAIPTLMSMKKAAESLGKLADTAREELPGTMAAVRLSGMEISDLTMELSDLGQEISAGVRNSSRAVRAAEDGLRRMGTFSSIAVLQERGSGQVEVVKPAVAHAARSTREALIRARSLVRSLITLTRLSSWFGHCLTFVRPWQRKAIPSRSP